MTTAQVLFSVALGLITLVILAFAMYVVSTATWGDRWAGKKQTIATAKNGQGTSDTEKAKNQ